MGKALRADQVGTPYPTEDWGCSATTADASPPDRLYLNEPGLSIPVASPFPFILLRVWTGSTTINSTGLAALILGEQLDGQFIIQVHTYRSYLLHRQVNTHQHPMELVFCKQIEIDKY